MNIIIRQEKHNEFKLIHDLVKVAFKTAKVSDGKEQDFIEQLRNSGNYVPELALIAEENYKLIGHIMMTKSYISNCGSQGEALLLAPISVVLEYRNKGVGSKLINTSFELARSMGYKSVFLVGDPAYYNRFGFRKSIEYGIRCLQNIPEEYVLACELVPGALDGVSGTIDCNPSLRLSKG